MAANCFSLTDGIVISLLCTAHRERETPARKFWEKLARRKQSLD